MAFTENEQRAHMRDTPLYTLWGTALRWSPEEYCAYVELVEITHGGEPGQVWSAHSAGVTSMDAIQAAVLAVAEGAQLTLF